MQKSRDTTACRRRGSGAAGDGWGVYNLKMRGKTFDPRSLARSLYKIGLGLVALSQGQEQACLNRYDDAREFTLEDQGFPNNLILRRECIPTPQVVTYYKEISPGTYVQLSIFGLVFMFNLEPLPTLTLNEKLVELKFDSFNLHDLAE